MTGRLDIELGKDAIEALGIANPQKKKTMRIHCITAQEVKRVLSELQWKVTSTSANIQDPVEQTVALHEEFVWANNELQLNKENK